MKGRFFAAVLCAAVACTALAACGEKGNGNGEGNPEESAVVLTKDTDFDALVSDKVTKEQWNAAFTDEAFAGVTVDFASRGFELETSFGYKKTADGCDLCFLVDMGEESNDMIARVVGTQATQYMKVGDAYYYETVDLSGDEHKVDREWAMTFRLYVAYDFAGQFDAFTYDETAHAYVYEGDTVEVPYTPMEAVANRYTVSYATLKFAGGKLAYAKVKVSNGEEEVFHYYDYGKTQVVIPTNALPADDVEGLF